MRIWIALLLLLTACDDAPSECEVRETCCAPESTVALCTDGIDNDGNGRSDCEDVGCRANPFVPVCDGERDCLDGADNDGNGLADCEEWVCAYASACVGEAACSDGIDNDSDGLTDCADWECALTPACAMEENTLAQCRDGLDNDNNGFADCADFPCSLSLDPAIADYCASLENCSDGVDNNGDGLVDCADPRCWSSPDPAVRGACEATYAACRDGEDNDGNGAIDCAEPSCRRLGAVVTHRPVDDTACGDDFDCRDDRFPQCLEGRCGRAQFESPCSETGAVTGTGSRAREAAEAKCSDGIDNDGDGFEDCEDWDCRNNPLLNPRVTDPSSLVESFCDARCGPGVSPSLRCADEAMLCE